MPFNHPRPQPEAVSARPLTAVPWACAILLAWVLVPLAARADDRCAQKCAQRQSSCTVSCAEGEKCREHCSSSAEACFAQCQRTDDKREVAQQRRAEKNCVGANGGMRRCTAAEAQQMREAMEQASKMFCRDKKGQQIVCPDAAKQVEQARRFIPKNCGATGCTAENTE
ncbi:hypothetical protein [Corallococcus aberystwythensis]|uniref:Uncharacterized protein n=1 Tax=Corallococcus aberystwythensis TaxID=2316722 RepID=A0A3A8R5N5_9BACT|nr:hypothetical protein [Corallococcus aberystwythensis]RKH74165.1 hypothetical protein D7W81_02415 [Corallococcus aberystwythensis]